MNESLLMLLVVTTGATLSILLLIYLAFTRIPKILKKETNLPQRLHDTLTLCAYALFPVIAVLNLEAFTGMVGDGFTSPYRQVSRETLIAIPVFQMTLFVTIYVIQKRHASKFTDRTSRAFLIPAILSILETTLWI